MLLADSILMGTKGAFFIFVKEFLIVRLVRGLFYVKDDIIAIISSFPHMSWVTKVNFVALFCNAQYLDCLLVNWKELCYN